MWSLNYRKQKKISCRHTDFSLPISFHPFIKRNRICGHWEQRQVKEPVQEKTETLLPGPQKAPLKHPLFLWCFLFSHCWPVQKNYTQCTVIITKAKCLEIICMLVAEENIFELELTFKYNKALKADSRKHLSMDAIFIFCMVHIQMFTTTMHLTAIMC